MTHHRTPNRSKRVVAGMVMFLALITLVLAPGLPVADAQTAQPQAAITADMLNVRGGPGTNYAIVGKATAGQTYPITGKSADGKWLVIDLSGKTGWVALQYVKPSASLDGIAVVKAPPAPKVAASTPRYPAAPGNFGYGVQAHMVDNDEAPRVMQSIRDLGFSWVKQQVEWKRFESSPGNIDFGALDNIINNAGAAGVNVLFSVVNSPTWAREPGFDQNSGGPPADPQTYANFVGQLASRYCNSPLKAIEVWNEQNMDYEWGRRRLDPNEYLKLLRPAYNAIKRACSSMSVISGALTPTGTNNYVQAVDDFEYLEKMYRAGLRNYSDGIGVHPSGYNVPPNVAFQNACAAIQQTGNSFNGACDNPHHSWSARSTIEGVRNIMVKYGDAGARIWPTEFGWAAGGAFDGRYFYANDNSYEEQAAWTVEFFRWLRSTNYVGPAFLWNLNFRVVANGTEKAQWGIVDSNWSPLPVYYALRDARNNGTLP